MDDKGGLVMVRQFKETSIEGKRLLHLGMAACMLMLVMVICHAEPVFAKNFEMDLDANKVTYTLTEAKSGEITFGAANTTGYIYVGKKPDTFVVKTAQIKLSALVCGWLQKVRLQCHGMRISDQR